MKFPEEMKTKARIEFLQRYILVHSCLYYSMDENVISDKKFDKYARLLASKIEKYRDKIPKTQYGYAFYDFDGTTGFDLMSRLKPSDKDRIEAIATSVLYQYKKDRRFV